MNIKGKYFLAAAHPDLQKTRPQFTFVPENLIRNGELDPVGYAAQRWHTINAGANSNSVGSHLYPDMGKELTLHNNPPGLSHEGIAIDQKLSEKFLQGLEKQNHKHKGAPSAPRKPGKQPEMDV